MPTSKHGPLSEPLSSRPQLRGKPQRKLRRQHERALPKLHASRRLSLLVPLPKALPLTH